MIISICGHFVWKILAFRSTEIKRRHSAATPTENSPPFFRVHAFKFPQSFHHSHLRLLVVFYNLKLLLFELLNFPLHFRFFRKTSLNFRRMIIFCHLNPRFIKFPISIFHLCLFFLYLFGLRRLFRNFLISYFLHHYWILPLLLSLLCCLFKLHLI